MPNIKSRCPHCFWKFLAPDSSMGREMNCTKCHKPFVITVHEEKPQEPKPEVYVRPLNAGYFYMSFWIAVGLMAWIASTNYAAMQGRRSDEWTIGGAVLAIVFWIGLFILASAGAVIGEMRRIGDRWLDLTTKRDRL